MGHFAPATLEIKLVSKTHSAQYAADFYRFLDVKRVLLHFASWAGIEVGYVLKGSGEKKGEGEEETLSSVWLVNQPRVEQWEESWTSGSPEDLENLSECAICQYSYGVIERAGTRYVCAAVHFSCLWEGVCSAFIVQWYGYMKKQMNKEGCLICWKPHRSLDEVEIESFLFTVNKVEYRRISVTGVIWCTLLCI